MKGFIALEDGTVFEGKSLGIDGEKEGEIVFNTSMTGYQEIMTDPSYKGQIVAMTYPLIGNYGVNGEDVESGSPKVEGFIAREFSKITSNFRAQDDLLNYLKKHNIIALEEVDTRALTKHIRLRGAMKAVISTIDHDTGSLIKKAKESQGIVGRDLVKEVTCEAPYVYGAAMGNGQWAMGNKDSKLQTPNSQLALRVVVMDYGVKMNILRLLKKIGCDVKVMPATAKAEEVLALSPDGVLLSNGPGDPEGVPYAIEEIRKLFGKLPIFGICLGQQLLGLAYGGRTYKLKFGHRGANQPIKELATGKVYITSENHGFAVDIESIKDQPVKATHINLNDNTIEGLEHEVYPIFSVQYHPEASPGPHDSYGLFAKFRDMMVSFKNQRS
ncbi:MAG: glutamine-hydrolyzing carbamoyl-phosphate synthase small subunit [Syntrophorhabdus sp.]